MSDHSEFGCSSFSFSLTCALSSHPVFVSPPPWGKRTFQYNRKIGKGSTANDLWIAFCYFHLTEYQTALEEYGRITKAWKGKDGAGGEGENAAAASKSTDKPSVPDSSSTAGELKDTLNDIKVYVACCQFYLGMYQESQATLEGLPADYKSSLKNRLSFHLALKLSDEKSLMKYHQDLQDVHEDQLCLAAVHYLRCHFQEAIDVYKKILLDHRDFLALNVYVALCYYKLDYYDVSQEVLTVYLQHHPDSVTAINLKASSPLLPTTTTASRLPLSLHCVCICLRPKPRWRHINIIAPSVI